MTACHVAAEVGAVEVVAALIKAGADCTLMAHLAAITPLIVAAAAGEEQMVSLLLAITSEVDALHQDKSGQTQALASSHFFTPPTPPSSPPQRVAPSHSTASFPSSQR